MNVVLLNMHCADNQENLLVLCDGFVQFSVCNSHEAIRIIISK